MQHHAFFIPAEIEEGIRVAEAWVEKELRMSVQANPDVVTLRHGLLSVADARNVVDTAVQAPIAGEKKALIVAASRAYHEAQNALLKIFEEPPPGTYLFLIMPSLGGLLPTLRSRVQVLGTHERLTKSLIPEAAEQFLKASREKRSAIIKRLTSSKDEDARRENREEAIELLNGIESAAYVGGVEKYTQLLSDISVLRGYLYDRSAPVKMILEHVSLVIPASLK